MSVMMIRDENGVFQPVKTIRGGKGEKGDKGKDGYTPVKNVDYFDGAPGAPGDPGYTPQKGVDYWTADDKAQIVNDVLAALPTWEGGAY